MDVVKILSIILLGIFLVFSGLVDFSGAHLSHFWNFLLGLTALASGVLMLISIWEYYHYPHEHWCEHDEHHDERH